MPRTSNTVRVAAAIALAVVAALALVACGGPKNAPRTVRYEIPRWSAQAADANGAPKDAARTIHARVGDTLLVVNHDNALHIVVGKPVRKGQTREIVLNQAGRFATSCSSHKRKSATIVVRERS